MTWRGPRLDADQTDLLDLFDSLAAGRTTPLSDDPARVAAHRAELAELGVWTLGVPEARGGGGATPELTTVAFERMGRTWPALGWASVQTHAALELLADDEPELAAELHQATAAVAVVEATAVHVRLEGATATRDAASGSTVTGRVDRVDAAHEAPHLLVLTGPHDAWLVQPGALAYAPVARTGLGGALTRSVTVDATVGTTARRLTGVDVAAARARLALGAGAVAAGIAGAAADAAAAYAGQRRQFGDVITALPTVRLSLVGQAARVAAMLDVLWWATPGNPVETLAAVRTACDGAVDVASDALQSHGGYGYLAEYDVERHLRDAVSLRAAADTHALSVASARTFVGLPPVFAPLPEEVR